MEWALLWIIPEQSLTSAGTVDVLAVRPVVAAAWPGNIIIDIFVSTFFIADANYLT